MVETLKTVLGTLLLLLQSRSRLQIEILVLRHQLIVLRCTAPKRARLGAVDRLLFVLLYRLWPDVLDSIAVIQPDTIVRWHRSGFRAIWRWKSRRRLGRPGISNDIRDLIREISRANPLWGAVGRKNSIRRDSLQSDGMEHSRYGHNKREGLVIRWMAWAIAALLKPNALLVAENLCLRQQLVVLQRRQPRPRLFGADRRFTS